MNDNTKLTIAYIVQSVLIAILVGSITFLLID